MLLWLPNDFSMILKKQFGLKQVPELTWKSYTQCKEPK